jgi:hypothetical protein
MSNELTNGKPHHASPTRPTSLLEERCRLDGRDAHEVRKQIDRDRRAMQLSARASGVSVDTQARHAACHPPSGDDYLTPRQRREVEAIARDIARDGDAELRAEVDELVRRQGGGH